MLCLCKLQARQESQYAVNLLALPSTISLLSSLQGDDGHREGGAGGKADAAVDPRLQARRLWRPGTLLRIPRDE